jgi:hypothetical protein
LQLYGIYPDTFIEERVAAFYSEKTKIVVNVDSNALNKIREEALETQERLTVEDGGGVRGLPAAQDAVNAVERVTAKKMVDMLDAVDTVETNDTVELLALKKDIVQLDMAETFETVKQNTMKKEIEKFDMVEQLTVKKKNEPLDTGDTLDTVEQLTPFETSEPFIPSEPPDTMTAFIQSLTQIELEAIRTVLRGGSLKAFADTKTMMSEVLVDGINEKAVDAIGDTVIEYDGQALIYEEYAAELNARVFTQ